MVFVSKKHFEVILEATAVLVFDRNFLPSFFNFGYLLLIYTKGCALNSKLLLFYLKKILHSNDA